jgi:putative acetyltransferase
MIQRHATDADSSALVELIGEIYSEYGEIMHTSGADADLLSIEASYAGRGGAFIVLEDASGKLVACHATSPIDRSTGLLTFRRLYLRRSLRGRGIGWRLMDWAVGWSRDHGYQRVEFWSDTRFIHAHDFFERYGFTKTGEIRAMDDGALPYKEYFFCLAL